MAFLPLIPMPAPLFAGFLCLEKGTMDTNRQVTHNDLDKIYDRLNELTDILSRRQGERGRLSEFFINHALPIIATVFVIVGGCVIANTLSTMSNAKDIALMQRNIALLQSVSMTKEEYMQRNDPSIRAINNQSDMIANLAEKIGDLTVKVGVLEERIRKGRD